MKAIVVLKPGAPRDAADIIAWARARIAHFKAPKSVDFVDSIPRNLSGKILKRLLERARPQGQLSRAGVDADASARYAEAVGSGRRLLDSPRPTTREMHGPAERHLHAHRRQGRNRTWRRLEAIEE